MEEQKIVKKVLKIQKTKEKQLLGQRITKSVLCFIYVILTTAPIFWAVARSQYCDAAATVDPKLVMLLLL